MFPLGGSLTIVRITACSILLFLVACTWAQKVAGTYHPNATTSQPWSINEHGTLVWDGQPYLPTGVIVSSPQEIEAADAAGIKDFILDLPASGVGWAQDFAALEAHHDHYVIRVSSLAPMVQGVAVEPQGYRFAGILTKKTIHASLPGVKSAFVVLALRRDGSIVHSGRVQVVDGQLDYPVDAPGGGEHVLLIYPILTSAQQPDYWDGLDQHRDRLFEAFRRHAPGPGLRGIVNPFGRTLVLPGKELRFIPMSNYFRMELRDLLLDRYKNLETAQRLWSLSSNTIKDFDELSRLVPLWSGTRGVSMMWDPETDKTYACDKTRSTVWADVNDVVNIACARRYQRIVDGIHSLVDVPVIQEWSGWSSTYETPTPSIDGIGMRSVGTSPSVILDLAGRAASSALRWKRTGWLPATDIDLGPGGDPTQLPGVLDDLSSVGARGWFVRADTSAILKAVAQSATRSLDATLAIDSPKAVFYPENASNPAQTQRLPGGTWWLPSPMSGERVDLGTNFSGYRYTQGGKSTFVLWAATPGREKLCFANPKTAVFTTIDGSDPKPKITPAKDGVELDLGSSPIIVTGTEEIPVPEKSMLETVAHFVQITSAMESFHQDAPEEFFTFKDLYPQFGQNPGMVYTKIREAYRTLSLKAGKSTWVEAENSKDTNFSEIDQLPACSNGQALSLRTSLPSDENGFYARYTIPVKTSDNQDVWIAARIPADRRGDIQLTMGGLSNGQPGGQTLSISADPISPYGNGFAWYKLGVTRLAGSSTNMTLTVNGQTASDLSIDAILLTPGKFTPNGVAIPDPIVFKPLNSPSKKKPGKKGN